MASIAEIRQKFPQYDDMSDQQLADALYAKHYSDMDRGEFDRRIGLAPQAAPAQPADPNADLPYPGNPNFDPIANAPKPNLGFGTSSSSTLNPLPAISSMGNNIAASVPIAGPYLKQSGEKLDAFLGGMTPEAVAAGNAELDRQNPGPAMTGKVVGSVAPYAVAAGVPVLSQALGMSGPLMQRLLLTGGSQFAINTGDNMANGQPLDQAAGNAVMPSLLAMPFALLGPSGQKMSPQRAAALDMLKQERIPITGGQATANKKLMYKESQYGGQAAQDFQEKQFGALTKTALRYAGVNADRADPEMLRKVYDEVGDKFANLASVTKPVITAPIYNDMLKVADEYVSLKGVNAAPLLEDIIQRVGNMATSNGGVLKGEQYKTLATDIRKYAETTSDIELKTALGEMREVLDDAVEKSMGGKTLEAWRKLRAQYRNLIVVTDAVSGGGDMALQGLIDPVSLNNAVRANVGKRNYAKGYGDLNELSRSARLVMPRLPDSGTGSRLSPLLTAGLSGTAGTSSFFGSGGNALATIAGAATPVAAAMAPYLAGKALLSPPVRRFIAAGGSTVPSTVSRGILPLLMGQ